MICFCEDRSVDQNVWRFPILVRRSNIQSRLTNISGSHGCLLKVLNVRASRHKKQATLLSKSCYRFSIVGHELWLILLLATILATGDIMTLQQTPLLLVLPLGNKYQIPVRPYILVDPRFCMYTGMFSLLSPPARVFYFLFIIWCNCWTLVQQVRLYLYIHRLG